jgi:hypothetical protein
VQLTVEKTGATTTRTESKKAAISSRDKRGMKVNAKSPLQRTATLEQGLK